MKRRIRLTEQDLKHLVSKSVRTVLREHSMVYDEWLSEEDYDGHTGEKGMVRSYDIGTYFMNNEDIETWYRGYWSRYGSDNTHLLWLTDDISYARTYGNRVEEILVDTNKLKLASLYDIDQTLGDEIDYYDGPSEEETKTLLLQGYNGYTFYANNDSSYCMCLFSKEPILKRKELSREDFESIETYEEFDNPPYEPRTLKEGATKRLFHYIDSTYRFDESVIRKILTYSHD